MLGKISIYIATTERDKIILNFVSKCCQEFTNFMIVENNLCFRVSISMQNYQRCMIDNNVTLQLGMQVVIVLDKNAVCAATRTKRKIPRDSQASDVK